MGRNACRSRCETGLRERAPNAASTNIDSDVNCDEFLSRERLRVVYTGWGSTKFTVQIQAHKFGRPVWNFP